MGIIIALNFNIIRIYKNSYFYSHNPLKLSSMKILVPIKRVVDANIKVRVAADNTGVDLNNVKMSMNPFCEIAVEEAVRLKEQGIATEVIAVTIGEDKAQEQLRTAMALGADRSIWIEKSGVVEPLAIAKLLQAVVEKEAPDLVILGKQSIDGDTLFFLAEGAVSIFTLTISVFRASLGPFIPYAQAFSVAIECAMQRHTLT